MSFMCPSSSPSGEVTSHHLEADVPFQSLANHSPSLRCTGSEGPSQKWLLPWSLPLLSPASCWLKRFHSHSSGLSCDSLPTPHLSRNWHFLSLGTQGFLATFKMSEFIVEPVCISNQMPALWPLGSSKLQVRRSQAPEPILPSLHGNLQDLGASSVEWQRDSSPVSLGSRGIEQTLCLTASGPWRQQGTSVSPDPGLLVMSK